MLKSEADNSGDRVVVVTPGAKCGVRSGIQTQIEIDQRGHMGGGEEAGVFERQPKVEDIGVGVERVPGRIDHFRAEWGREHPGLHVQTAGEHRDREMPRGAGFHHVELVALVDRHRLVQEPEIMRIARIRAIHERKLKSPVETGGVRVELFSAPIRIWFNSG